MTISDQYFPPTACRSCHKTSCRAKWHEYMENDRAAVVWQCEDCGCVFDSVENSSPRKLSDHELVHTFLPNLMVG